MKIYHNKVSMSRENPRKNWFAELLIEAVYEALVNGKKEKTTWLCRLLLATSSGRAILT